METRVWNFNTDIMGYGYHADPAVIAAADACGAVLQPTMMYRLEGTYADGAPLRDVLEAIRLRKVAERDARSAASRARTARQQAATIQTLSGGDEEDRREARRLRREVAD